MSTTPPITRTYGNFRRPTSPGIGDLGLAGTMLVFGGLIVLIILMAMKLLIPAVVWSTGVAIVLLLLLARNEHGVTGVQRIAARAGWRRTRKLGQHLYRSGPLGASPWGTCQLPGLLAASRCHEFKDSYGRPFGMIELPQVGHFSVAIVAEPDGASLVDDDQVDSWVAYFGQWLGSLGQEMGIVAASVTIETAPDTGSKLRREVVGRIDPNAPALAQAMLRQVASDYPAGSASVRAFVALTFDGRTYAGKKREVGEVARDVAARLPSLTQRLAATGAGVCRPATAQQLCEVVRAAYDPAAAVLIEDARAEGNVPELSWNDVGPAALEAGWDWLRHDSAWSQTWMMTTAPRGEVTSTVLSRLVAPHPDVDRKRVTMIYRPLDAARAARTVEQDKRNADFRVSSSTRPSARSLLAQRAASAAATEEARGAGLVDFGILITATVTDQQRIPDARAAVENLAATARLMVRPVYGSQDSAFAAGLPLGLVLPAHLRIPAELRQAL
ncbi:hypothetical protein GCM10027425_33590 [Alteromonas gracilis]